MTECGFYRSGHGPPHTLALAPKGSHTANSHDVDFFITIATDPLPPILASSEEIRPLTPLPFLGPSSHQNSP